MIITPKHFSLKGRYTIGNHSTKKMALNTSLVRTTAAFDSINFFENRVTLKRCGMEK